MEVASGVIVTLLVAVLLSWLGLREPAKSNDGTATQDGFAAREDKSGAASRKKDTSEILSGAIPQEPRSQTSGQPVVAPLVRWTFENGVADTDNLMPVQSQGDAAVQDGRLILVGKESFLKAGPLTKPVTERTFEVWLTLTNLSQKLVAPLTISDNREEDGILFGHPNPQRWGNFSPKQCRSQNVDGRLETAKAGEFVHIAMSFARDGTIQIFRNGEPYGSPYRKGNVATYPAGKSYLYIGGTSSFHGPHACMLGEIEEARFYDQVLTPEEVKRSYEAFR